MPREVWRTNQRTEVEGAYILGASDVSSLASHPLYVDHRLRAGRCDNEKCQLREKIFTGPLQARQNRRHH
jgi:hypothetical protein